MMQVLLETNTAGNLQLVVQVAKEYTEQLGAGKIMELLESHKSYHGLYYYLGGHIAFSEDPEVHLMLPEGSRWCCLHWQLLLAESRAQGQELNGGFRVCASIHRQLLTALPCPCCRSTAHVICRECRIQEALP